VLFVGANPPSLEWIQTKAKPLIVRKENFRMNDYIYTEQPAITRERKPTPTTQIVGFAAPAGLLGVYILSYTSKFRCKF
jgi:hypothetical protein